MPVLTCLLLQIIEDLMSVLLAVPAAGDVWFDSFDKLRNRHTNRVYGVGFMVYGVGN